MKDSRTTYHILNKKAVRFHRQKGTASHIQQRRQIPGMLRVRSSLRIIVAPASGKTFPCTIVTIVNVDSKKAASIFRKACHLSRHQRSAGHGIEFYRSPEPSLPFQDRHRLQLAGWNDHPNHLR